MHGTPKVFGAAYSVYVRIVRLALIEKQVPYELVPVDIFAKDGPPPDYRERQPFGRIPAFAHGDFSVYETGAIARYVDEAFEGPALQPAGAQARARCNQIVSIADNYAYPHLVWGLYVEQVSKPRQGALPDPDRIATSRAAGRTCLGALECLIAGDEWLTGRSITLADLYLAPMVAYFVKAPDADAMLRFHPRLAAWWRRIGGRASMRQTDPDAAEAPGLG